jgi:hypothetical protein
MLGRKRRLMLDIPEPRKGDIRWYEYYEGSVKGKVIVLLLEDYRYEGTKCFVLSDSNGTNKVGSITKIYGLDTAKPL